MKQDCYEEVEVEYKVVFCFNVVDIDFKIGFVDVFCVQQKIGFGLVLIEELVEVFVLLVKVWLVYVKLLL